MRPPAISSDEDSQFVEVVFERPGQHANGGLLRCGEDEAGVDAIVFDAGIVKPMVLNLSRSLPGSPALRTKQSGTTTGRGRGA